MAKIINLNDLKCSYSDGCFFAFTALKKEKKSWPKNLENTLSYKLTPLDQIIEKNCNGNPENCEYYELNLQNELKNLKCPNSEECFWAYSALGLSKKFKIKNSYPQILIELEECLNDLLKEVGMEAGMESIEEHTKKMIERCNKNYRRCAIYFMDEILENEKTHGEYL